MRKGKYKRWCDRGIWEHILAEIIDDPDMEWLMIDGSHYKVHPHAAGAVAVGGNQDMERTKGGLNTKIYLAMDANGMPIRFAITKGTTHDCKKAIELIDGFEAGALLADRGYDSDVIIAFAASKGMEIVIPPKKNRKLQRKYDKCLYKVRYLVENAFLKLKRWRGVATRYAKTTSGFTEAVTLACIMLWLYVVARLA